MLSYAMQRHAVKQTRSATAHASSSWTADTTSLSGGTTCSETLFHLTKPTGMTCLFETAHHYRYKLAQLQISLYRIVSHVPLP
jgi:hypothetical protein